MTDNATAKRDGLRFGPFDLTARVTHGNMWSLAFGAFTTIGLLAFVAVATPYVLTVNLGIPEDEQGTITGDLVFWAEVTQILIFGLVGVAVVCCVVTAVVVASAIGGRLFDSVGPAGPFLLVGVFNAIVLCMAIVVRIAAPAETRSGAGASS